MGWRKVLVAMAWLSTLVIGEPVAWAASDSHVDSSGKSSRVLVSPETLQSMIALMDKWAAARVRWQPGARDFLGDSMQSLERKQRDDTKIVGLEFNHDKDEKDCNIYYRSAATRSDPQKEFVREKGSCTLMRAVVFSIFLQTRDVLMRTKLLRVKDVVPAWTSGYTITDANRMLGINNVVALGGLTEMMVALARHPELGKVFEDQGLRLMSVSIPVKKVTVSAGESLWSVADGFGLSTAWPSIGAVNAKKLTSWKAVQAGAEVRVPAWLGVPVEATKMYRVTSGDTLRTVAQREFGKADYWGLVYVMNLPTVNDPDVLTENSQLRLPKDSLLILRDVAGVVELKTAVLP